MAINKVFSISERRKGESNEEVDLRDHQKLEEKLHGKRDIPMVQVMEVSSEVN